MHTTHTIIIIIIINDVIITSQQWHSPAHVRKLLTHKEIPDTWPESKLVYNYVHICQLITNTKTQSDIRNIRSKLSGSND